MNKKLFRIILTVVLLVAAVIIEKTTTLPTWQLLLVFLVPYLLIGYDVLGEAAEGIAHGEPFNEHFLMSVATIGALLIGFLPGAETEFPEAVFVMLFFQVGELFEGYAEGKSRESIAHLMDIRPDSAHVERGGEEVTVSPEEVAVGETIVVKPGEKVPMDGIIVEGSSSLNTVALTGESVPRDVTVEDEAISGCVNLSGLLRIRVTKAFGESTVAKIINLVENAGEKKSKSETFIARFARVYTPIVVFAALAIAIIPPLFSGHFSTAFPTWLYRALMFLVVSCPCALVISVPLSFFGGIGGASRKGILIKGASYMDILADLHTVVFDKTGTLTHGQFEVEAVHPKECDEHHLLHLAAHVERHSTHPIAQSLRNAYPDEADDCTVEDVVEVAGQGIRARVNGDIVCVGNTKMMEAVGAQWHDCHKVGTIVHVSINGTYAGHIVISDKVKADAAEAVGKLKDMGVRTVMLTGDRREVGEDVAARLGIDDCHTQLLPTDKVSIVEKLLQQRADGRQSGKGGYGDGDFPAYYSHSTPERGLRHCRETLGASPRCSGGGYDVDGCFRRRGCHGARRHQCHAGFRHRACTFPSRRPVQRRCTLSLPSSPRTSSCPRCPRCPRLIIITTTNLLVIRGRLFNRGRYYFLFLFQRLNQEFRDDVGGTVDVL